MSIQEINKRISKLIVLKRHSNWQGHKKISDYLKLKIQVLRNEKKEILKIKEKT